MIGDAAFRFGHALSRRPSPAVVDGLRAAPVPTSISQPFDAA